MTDEHLRLSDAERDRAAAELADHYAQGRLSVEEHGQRLDQVWAARTRGDLLPVFRDLPGGTYGGQVAPRPGWTGWRAGRGGAPRRRGAPAPLLVLLVVLMVFTVVTHLPIIVIGLLAWVLFANRHRRHTTYRRW
jgi:uncharacterized protein DUF1707